MIVVKITENEIAVEGHAGYGPPGSDIVCAGVSALSQTLVNSLKSLTHDHIWHVVREGYIKIEYENLSEQGKLLVDSFFIGICQIADAYKEYVQII